MLPVADAPLLSRLPALARDFCPRQEQSLTLAASEDWSRAVVLADGQYAQLNPREEHTVHPVPFYAG